MLRCGEQVTTDEELLRIARDVAARAAGRRQDARLIGNVTAGELLVLANRLPELMASVEHGRKLERADVSWYLRSTPRAGGVLISIEHSNTVARLAGDIERGEHVKP